MSRFIFYLLGLLILLAIGGSGFYYYRERALKQPSSTTLPSVAPTPTLTIPTSSPSLSPKNYEKGVVLVSFNDGVTYKEARDFLSSFDLQIENTNSYWRSINFQPSELTELKKADIFKIGVPPGKEDEIINQLLQGSIVKTASKNFSVRIH